VEKGGTEDGEKEMEEREPEDNIKLNRINLHDYVFGVINMIK